MADETSPEQAARLTLANLEDGRREMQERYGGEYWTVAADDGRGSVYFIDVTRLHLSEEGRPSITMRERLTQLYAPPPSNVEAAHG